MKNILTLIVTFVFGCQLQAQVSFVLSSSPGVGGGPWQTVAADLNGDGKVDLICANQNGASLSVLTNNGSGGFVLSATLSVGNAPVSVAAADINGDGKVDLISANANDNTITILTNNGSGGFVLAHTYAVGNDPRMVVAADVNGDGKPDLIIANQNDSTLTVLTNNGSGGFILAGTYSVGNGAYAVAAADINGDGKVDLISANFYANTLTVLTNNGSGGFATSGTYAVGSAPNSIAVADVNGDGKLDLVCANLYANTLSVLTNNGTGGFELSGTYAVGSYPDWVIAADVNGDGKPDLICANQFGNSLQILTNNGSGVFMTATNITTSTPDCVVAADVNNDGKLDLIAANLNVNTLSVFTNATPFPSPSCTPAPSGLVSWWPAEGNANDVVGGNNGVTQNITYAGGEVGSAFYLNGSNAYVKVPASASLNVGKGSGLTFEAWINPTTLDSQAVAEWNDGVGDLGTHLFITERQYPTLGAAPPGCIYANVIDTSGNSHVFSTGGGVVVSNNYQHIALTYDKTIGIAVLYCNGNPVQTANLGLFTPQTSYDLYLGVRASGFAAGGYFAGMMDEPSLYNRALSASEIAAIYNAGSAGKCPPTMPPTNACMTPPANLVSWWPAEGNANDIIGGNNGVLEGNVTYAPGEVGQAFSLNDTNSDVRIPASASLNIGTGSGLTLEAWINPSDVAQLHPIFEWNNGNSEGFGVHFYISVDAGPGSFYANIVDSGGGWHQFHSNVAPLKTNVFQHVALTYDKTTGVGTMYCNGVMVAQQNLGSFTPQTSPDLYLGRRPSDEQFAYTGLIDEASVYGRALSQTEILAVYNAGSAGKCSAVIPPSVVPSIISFTPATGTNGTVIAISGTNFSATAAADIVYFGAVQAAVLSAGSTSLQVTVPVGATYAPITVTVNGLTAYADQPFTPTFPGLGQIDNTSLAPRLDLPTGNGPGKDVIADLDGDGKPDLISADAYSGEISIYRNISTNGSLTAGSFAPRVDLPLLPSGGSSPYTIVAADLDGDGRLDLIVLNPDYNVVSILRNISSPGNLTTNSFAARMDLPAGNIMRGLAVQDLNGDGKPEIVTANYGDNTISVFQNMSTIGNIAFAVRVNFAAGNGPQGLAIGDLDGDGNPDLVAVNWNSSTLSVFRNLGTGGNITTNSFAPQVSIPTLATPFPIAIGDLDGDGKLDLVVGGNENSSAISVYRNTSTAGSINASSFAAPVTFSAPGWVNSIALADLDGDGKLDVAVACQISSVFSIFKNVSTPGSFTTASLAARVDYPAGYNPDGVAIGDLDGDGRPDIIFGNWYDGTISIYRNIVPFVAPPVADATATVPLVISVNNSNATVILNGSLSSDPNGKPLQYTWYQTGSPNPLATGVIAVVVLPVGTNFITLLVSDGLASSQQTIMVAVITLAQAVDQLEAVVNADVAKQQSLIAILNAALGAIDRSNPTAAINQLQAFQNQVSAQISPLNPTLAQTLIGEAQSIINAISSGAPSSHKTVNATVQGNGKMHLNFSGMQQQVYIIESSTNMVDWEMIGVANNQGDGTFNFDDAVSTQTPARYYRVVTP